MALVLFCGAASGDARHEVAWEVHHYFPHTGKVTAKCHKVGDHKRKCSWRSKYKPDPYYDDYYGLARVKHGDAHLYHVRCLFCVDGPPPEDIR